jgi:hypothetical protein
MLRYGLILAITLGGLTFATSYFLTPACCKDGISELVTAEPKNKAQQTLRILFVGNSYTFYHRMPEMIAQLAASDPENTTRLEIQSVTRGGIALKDLWETGDALELLVTSKWDYVVLQEQSFWAMFPESIRVTNKIVKTFNQSIKQAGAQTVLFVTWPRQPGSSWYNSGQYSFLKSPPYMQQQFDYYSAKLANSINAPAIAVGDYWSHTLAAYPGIPLYMSDGSHPSPTGSYLAALLFYRFFSGHKPLQAAFVPSGVDPQHASILRSLVSN